MTGNCAVSPENVRLLLKYWDAGCKGLCGCRQAFKPRSL
jgi:hypothetical protein